MSRLHKFLTTTAMAAVLLPIIASAQSTTYAGNGAGSFGGPIGQGSLNFTSNGTTITGTLTIGGNFALNDDLVVYIDAQSGGYTDTSSFTDTGNGNDRLRKAVSGYNGTTRAQVNFGSGFGADYALAISPGAASFASFYTLNSSSGFLYGSDNTNGSLNVTPNNTNNGNGTHVYTFTFSNALIGNATSFNFLSTYLNGNDAYRSNEAIGNSITDIATGNSNGTVAAGSPGAGSAGGSLGSDTAFLDGIQTFTVVPEPGTWLAGGLLVAVVGWSLARSRRSSVA